MSEEFESTVCAKAMLKAGARPQLCRSSTTGMAVIASLNALASKVFTEAIDEKAEADLHDDSLGNSRPAKIPCSGSAQIVEEQIRCARVSTGLFPTALRGWAVPLVMPIAQAWKAFDKQGTPTDAQLTEQLRALGREVARGSCQFALEPPTKADAARAETEITPLSDEEAKIA